jgi:hypothetical protein
LEGWKVGKIEGGRSIEWKVERLEGGRKVDRVEGWKVGKLEGGRLEGGRWKVEGGR